MVLRFFLLVSVFLFMYCAVPERDDPDDPKSTYYRGNANGGSSNENSAKVSSSSVATPSSSSSLVQYGSPVTYGGETYQTVVIGTQTWMARNLNYNASGSKCGNGSSLSDENTSTCNTYGRLYNWATANTVCPSGWHLPSDAEWSTLTSYVGSNAGTKLKAKSGWNAGGNGTDEFGFSALPGGNGSSNGKFYDYEVGLYGDWWSATEYDASGAYYRYIFYNSATVTRHNIDKSYLFSVRCVQD
jgi:uncharacterized protein (TIGR02145 family)